MTFNMLHHALQEQHCKPDAHTYAALIDACTRADKPDMALQVYGRAMASKVGSRGVILETQTCMELVLLHDLLLPRDSAQSANASAGQML